MATDNNSLPWQNVNLSKLPAAVIAKHDAIDAARRGFEDALAAAMAKKGMVPKNHVVKFNHRWGKVSVAVVEQGTATGSLDLS